MSESTIPGQSRFAHFWDELGRGYRDQTNVILALIFKDLRLDATRGKLGIAWAIAEPMIYISIMAGVWRPTGITNINGVSIFLFLVCGVIAYIAIRQSITTVALAPRRSDALFDYPQVKPIDTIIASFIYETILLFVSAFIFLSAVAWFWELVPTFPDPLGVLYVVGLLLIMALGVAMFLGTYAALYDDISKGLGFMSRPLLFLSAVFYSLNQLPGTVRQILSWNPLAQIIEYLRHYMLGLPLFPEASLEYAGLCSFLIFALGTMVYTANRFRLIQR